MSFNHISFIEEVVRDYYASIHTVETVFDIHYNRVFGNSTRQEIEHTLQAIIGSDNITNIKLYDFLFFRVEDVVNDNDESDAETEDEMEG